MANGPRLPWPKMVLVLLQLALVACQVAIKISSDSPPVFMEETLEPKLMVGILPAGSSVPPHVRTLPMTDANGTKYNCYLPSMDEQELLSTAMDTALLPQQSPEELLDALKEWCTYRVEEWWTYELCYKKHVRQYHKEHKKVAAEYLLGQFNEEGSEMNTVQTDTSDVSGGLKYVSQQYTGGDACELTEQPRTAEVRYICSKSGAVESQIVSIQEPASCSYLITVATPRLCKHSGFQAQPPPVAAIKCIPHAFHDRAAAADGAEAAGGAVVALPSGSSEGQCAAGAGRGEEGAECGAAAGSERGSVEGELEGGVQSNLTWHGDGGEGAGEGPLYDPLYEVAAVLGDEEELEEGEGGEYADDDDGGIAGRDEL